MVEVIQFNTYMLIDCIELAIFASFLRGTLPKSVENESKMLKRYTNG